MKKIILFALCIFIIACSPGVYNGRKAYKEYFQKTLKDPESLKIYSEKYEKESGSVYTIHWTLDIGARNSYGGMVRETYHITTIAGSKSIYVQRGEYGKEELFNLDKL